MAPTIIPVHTNGTTTPAEATALPAKTSTAQYAIHSSCFVDYLAIIVCIFIWLSRRAKKKAKKAATVWPGTVPSEEEITSGLLSRMASNNGTYSFLLESNHIWIQP